MADYWKSNPRKFCEICQCWMADNKISVQNHESGNRHKANVEKKMNELQRSGMNAEKEKQKLQDSLQKINDSAFVGMMKDLARDPSLAKRYGVVLTEEQELACKRESESQSKKKSDVRVQKAPTTPVSCEWQEATAPDGRKYYWNFVTRETQWTRPDGAVAPEVVSVKEEKNRLQHFVLNRLVELSESGSDRATAAVHRAFNAPVSEAEEDSSQQHVPSHVNILKSEQNEPLVYKGPKIDLLGSWVPVEEEPPKKQLKLGLPSEKQTKRSSSASTSSTGATDSTEDKESRSTVLAHLEETTLADIYGSACLETTEKQLAPGALSKSSSSSDTTNRNVPRLVFRRNTNVSSTRNFRTSSTDE